LGWREYLRLFQKYEGDIGLATGQEIEHAGRGMDPATARRIAESDYKRRGRIKENEQNNNKIPEAAVGDRHFADSLF